MILVDNYFLAILCCVICCACWGSWANTQKMVAAKQWSFELFYWDLTVGLFLTALLADGTKKFEEEGTSKLKSTFEDDLGDVLDRIQALNSDKCAYTSYSGKANGMDGSVKFIIETAAIEAAEE